MDLQNMGFKLINICHNLLLRNAHNLLNRAQVMRKVCHLQLQSSKVFHHIRELQNHLDLSEHTEERKYICNHPRVEVY